MKDESVWLNREQLSILFDRDVKTIGKHINNALKEELDSSTVAKFATTAKDGKTYQVEYYNFDMIMSVGYRVKSQNGIIFRKWANKIYESIKQTIKDNFKLILSVIFISHPTPKKFITDVGLMSTVNNDLTKFDEIFIAEMGAYRVGRIKNVCNLVHPKYGILTTIGKAHLETFGSQENIIKTKFELIESLPSDGIAFLNKDDPLQVNYVKNNLKNKVKIVWYAVDNKEASVYAKNIKCSNTGSTFDVVFKKEDKTVSFETRLLGRHNISNILSGLAVGYEFGIPIEKLVMAVKKIKPIEHRLELKRLGLMYQIDDAYNSNPIGAKVALEVLDMMPGTKVVVTPGMVELGGEEAKLNFEFGTEIASVADYVILVGEKQTKPIYEGLISKKYKKDNIIITNDVREAYTMVNNLKEPKKDIYALFENDLPDTYNE